MRSVAALPIADPCRNIKTAPQRNGRKARASDPELLPNKALNVTPLPYRWSRNRSHRMYRGELRSLGPVRNGVCPSSRALKILHRIRNSTLPRFMLPAVVLYWLPECVPHHKSRNPASAWHAAPIYAPSSGALLVDGMCTSPQIAEPCKWMVRGLRYPTKAPLDKAHRYFVYSVNATPSPYSLFGPAM